MDKVADVAGVLSFYHESFKLNEIYLQLFKTNANNEKGLYHDVNVKDMR